MASLVQQKLEGPAGEVLATAKEGTTLYGLTDQYAGLLMESSAV
jgi:hypothetical protein